MTEKYRILSTHDSISETTLKNIVWVINDSAELIRMFCVATAGAFKKTTKI